MTDLLNDVDAPSDAELISRVRGGDVDAYGDLFARHVDAAKRLSRQLVRGPDADDLVSEAFAKVLTVLQGGGGPDVAFRAYLLTAVRRLHVDRIRSGARLQTSDDMEAFDPGVPFRDTAVDAFESGAAARAFASLPERWQLVLWHLEVEGQKPADVAPLLGMSPNSVSALAYRAREGLRQAFLTMHLNDISETDCRWVNEHLGAYVRNGLAKRESTKVRAHLDECRRCTAMYLELTEVNSDLKAIIAPLLLGAAAAGYLASTGTAAGGLGVMALFGRVRDTVTANAGAATAGAVAAGVAAAVTAGIVLLPSSGPDRVIGADGPSGTVSTPGAPSSAATPDDTGRPGGRTESPEEAGPTPAADLPSVVPSLTAAAAPAPGTGTTDQPAGPGDGATGPGDETPGAGNGSPGTTEPTPTGPAPTEPGPNEPPPVSYTVQVNGSRIENGQVTFDLTGDPLPATVYLTIESPSAGISFESQGSSTCVRISPLLARCSTTPTASTVLTPLARVVALALQSPVQVSMPFAGAPEVDTDVTIALSAPLGTVWDRVTLRYDVPDPVPAPDIALSLGSATPVLPGPDGTYRVNGIITGVPATTSAVSLSLTGDATVVATGSDSPCTADGRTVVCTPATGATSLPFTLTLGTPDNDDDRTVSLALTSPIAYPGDLPANNTTGDFVLKASPAVADLRYSSGPTATLEANNDYRVSATVAGIPPGATSLTFSFPEDSQARFKLPVLPVCAISGDERTMVCPVPDGATEVVVRFNAQLPAGKGHLLVEAGDLSVGKDIEMPALGATAESASARLTLRSAESATRTSVATTSSTDRAVAPVRSAKTRASADGPAPTKAAKAKAKAPRDARRDGHAGPADTGKVKSDAKAKAKAATGIARAPRGEAVARNVSAKPVKDPRGPVEQVVEALASLLP